MPSYDELQRALKETADRLESESDLTESLPGPITADSFGGLGALLRVAAESMGECRMAVPYSPMHPVRHADGRMTWCCNHDPEHCGDA